jgi:hypothetical protein
VGVHGGTLEDFLSMIAGEAHQQRNTIRTPLSKCFTHGCARGFWGEWETKITNTELNWLYSALIAKQSIDPTHLGSGCYLSMLAISLRLGITRNLKHLLPGTSLRFEYMKQQIHKWRWERRLQSGQGEFAPIGWKIKAFLEGKEDWLEKELLVLANKNKRGRIIGEDFFHDPRRRCATNYVPPFGGIPAPPSYYGGVPMQAWGSGAAIPHQTLWCPT